MPDTITVSVNAVEHAVAAKPARSLLHVLREEFGLTGAKYSCGEGKCGACTTLIDGAPARSCVKLVADVAGASITTVEGLAEAGVLHPVQQAFVEVGAMQCGYCTSGMLLSAAALLAANPAPTDDEVIAALNGNICRCGTHPRIIRAVHRAAELIADRAPMRDSFAPQPQVTAQHVPWDLLEPADRDYFDALGDGLVVVYEAGAAWGDGGAWLHIGEDDIVTAFTGKMNCGQDNRTALTTLVAEELGVPMDSVRLVMGDTDVCPYDAGTFGSRSMPFAAASLRSAAAHARELRKTPTAQARRLEIAPRTVELSSADGWTVAGTPVPALTSTGIVTAAATFPSDMTRPDMLHAKVLRPPLPGLSLESVDLDAALELPGVTVYRDDDFVAVTADDPATAARALACVDAVWQSPDLPDEHAIADHLRENPIDVEGWGAATHDEAGDVDAALAAAETQISQTYTTAYIAHAPLEPTSVVAEWNGDRLTVWTGTQVPFSVRAELAETLEMAQEQIRVIVPDTGGAFGGRVAGGVAAEAAVLAQAEGRPVKIMWSRRDEFTAGRFRPAGVMDMRAGVDADGQLIAWDCATINAGAEGISLPYTIEHQRLSFQPADSPLPEGPYRAVAATANAFARESCVDEVARAIERDPLTFRLEHVADDRLAAVLTAAADRFGWSSTSRADGRGIGVACGIEKGSRVATCVEVEVPADGVLRVVRAVTAFDCGTIINPDNLENQIVGATIMGLGGALFEAIHFDTDGILNPSFAGYRVPRFKDVPPIDVVLVSRPDLRPAGGAETPIIAIAPALANAIADATGTRLRSLPLIPDGVVSPGLR